jgi:hypothetical protein
MSGAPGVAIAAFFVASCAGDQHQSAGRFRLTATGALTARVEGAARAEYAHRVSSTGPGFSIGLEIPAGNAVFSAVDPTTGAHVDTDRGMLVLALDSFPEPGTYAPRPVTRSPPSVRRERTVGVLLISSSGARAWDPIGGEVRFARTPRTRDGLRAALDLRLVRTRCGLRPCGPPDTAVVTGSLETR